MVNPHGPRKLIFEHVTNFSFNCPHGTEVVQKKVMDTQTGPGPAARGRRVFYLLFGK